MFTLRLFGGLSLESDAGPAPREMLQRRRLALLAALALAGVRGLTREQVQAYLWPDSPDDRARHALDQLLYLTRRALGRDAVLAEGAALRLNPEVVASDVAQFEQALAGGDLACAAEAYTGPLLDGVRFGEGELERWADEQRERWARRYAGVLERLASAAEREGAHAAAAEWWRRRVALDPYAAPATVRLMQALAAAGDHAAAVRQARIYETLVRGELAVEPDASVAALAARLATQPPSAPAPSRDVQPSAPTLTPSGAPPEALPDRRRRWAPVAALAGAAAMLLVGVLGAWTSRRQDTDGGARPGVAAPAYAVAVLPLVDLSAGPGGEYLANGLTEELIHALSRVPELRVVARTSVFALRGRAGDVRHIGRTLGARFVVEGSLRREGDRVRVHVRLVDAVTGYERWSESYDRGLADVLAMERDIADAVTKRLSSGDVAAAPSALAREDADTRSSDAFEHYLRARFDLSQGTAAGRRRAAASLHAAVALDPRYARAHAALAEAYNGMAAGASGQARQRELLAKAEGFALRAVELDPHLAEAHVSLAAFRMNRWEWDGAEAALRRAIGENPSLAAAHQRYGVLLALRGRFDAAVAATRRARELDPLSYDVQASAAYVLGLARQDSAAEAVARRLVALAPEREDARFRLGLVLLQQGRTEEAVAELRAAAELRPGSLNRALPLLGYAYARAGRDADAARLRPLVDRGLADRSLSPYYAVAYLSAVGQTERAFALLDGLRSRRESCLQDLAVDPVMEPLRADPRFVSVANAVGAYRLARAPSPP